jgi:hypothetical protein
MAIKHIIEVVIIIMAMAMAIAVANWGFNIYSRVISFF